MFCELNDLNMFRARQLKHVKRKLPELEASLERPYTRGQAEIMKQGSWLKLRIFENLFTSTAITAMVRFGLYRRLWNLSSRFAGSDSRWKGPVSDRQATATSFTFSIGAHMSKTNP
jgi:hypothetical protein